MPWPSWAGVLVALSPFAVYYSQETRMYAQLGLLSVASMWVLVRWLISKQIHHTEATEKNKVKAREISSHASPSPFTGRVSGGGVFWRWPVALALINAAGVYTQYSYPFTMSDPSDPSVRIHFGLGNDVNNVWLDNIKLYKIVQEASPGETRNVAYEINRRLGGGNSR